MKIRVGGETLPDFLVFTKRLFDSGPGLVILLGLLLRLFLPFFFLPT